MTAELMLAVAVAAAVSLVIQFGVGRLHIPMPSNAPTALMTLTTTLVAAGLLTLAVLLRRRWRGWATWVTWGGLSALTTLALALPLEGTRYYLGGMSTDQIFRTQYLTRLASSPGLADMNYYGIPGFYPAGWFWVGARFANLTGLPAWAAFKPFAITSMAVTAVIVFTLWRLIVRRHMAVLLALVTAVIGVRVGAPEPYTWLLAATLPPVAVIAMRALGAGLARDDGQHEDRRRWALVGVGVFIGVAGAFYTLYFGFAVLFLVSAAVVVAVLVRVSARRQGKHLRWLTIARPIVLRLVAIGLIALPIMLLVWLPYLLWGLQHGFQPGAAQHYLPPDAAVFPLPMLDFSVRGVVCLAGTIWLVLAAGRSVIARGLLVLAMLVYGWYVLSTLALAAHTTLLAFRLNAVLITTLVCAGILGLIEAGRALYAARWWRLGIQGRRHSVAAGSMALGLAALVTLIQPPALGAPVDSYDPGYVNQAYSDYYPTGVTALGKSDPADNGAWNSALIKTINRLTGKPPQNVIVLSTYYELLSFEPYWGFQQITAHYANPVANFDARRAEVAQWTHATDSADLISRLNHSPFTPPSVFVLRRASDGLHMTLSRDVFPREPNVQYYDVVFPEHLFDSPQFVRADVGPFVVAVRR